MAATQQRPQVVVIGAGFGGVEVARQLRKAPVEVTVIDRQNYHTFQPLMYQVATAGLEPEEIAHAVRGIFQRQRNFRFRLGTVTGVDFAASEVRCAEGPPVPFDYLIVAAGLTTSYFGVPGAEAHSFPLKSLPEAMALRSHVIRQFERADRTPALIDDGALTFGVVGGGPTGVELAGALAELFQMVLKKDFPHLPIDRARVVLIEMQDHLLDAFHEKSQAHARATLAQRGVELRFGEQVVEVTERAVHLKSGEVLPTHTLIWAAGVRAVPLADALGLAQTQGGQIEVEDDLRVPGHAHVFVIGDLAAHTSPDGTPDPQLAANAIQGGKHVARQIPRLLAGQTPEPYRYTDKGIMATIGRNQAVAELAGGLRTRGFLAWVMWLALHLVMLIGFRNRLQVLINWCWNYLTYDRAARLILGPSSPLPPAAAPTQHPAGTGAFTEE